MGRTITLTGSVLGICCLTSFGNPTSNLSPITHGEAPVVLATYQLDTLDSAFRLLVVGYLTIEGSAKSDHTRVRG